MHSSQLPPAVECDKCGKQISETTASGNPSDGFLCTSCDDSEDMLQMMLKIAEEHEE